MSSFLYGFQLSELPMTQAMLKLANLPEPPPDFGEVPQEEVKQPASEVKRPILHALKATMAPALAFGVGTAAGYGAQAGVEKLMGKALTPTRARMAAPILGGAMGLAYNQYKAYEQQELRRALEAHKNKPTGAVSAE
jgi:hypothetical protein